VNPLDEFKDILLVKSAIKKIVGTEVKNNKYLSKWETITNTRYKYFAVTTNH
jgi:hypothetical protein